MEWSRANAAAAIRVAVFYIFFGAAWILLTDLVVEWWAVGPEEAFWQTVKGLLFVLCSGLLIYFLIRRELRERTDLEAQLYEAKTLFDEIFGTLDDAVFFVRSSDRVITECNEAAERIFRCQREALLDHSTRRFHIDEEHYQRFDTLTRDELKKRGVARVVFQMRRATGEIFPSEHTVVAIGGRWDETGEVLSIIRDISRQREAEEEIKQSQAHLGTILETVADAIVFVDRDGQVQFANPAAQELLGLDESDVSAVQDSWSRVRLPGGEPMDEENSLFGEVMENRKPAMRRRFRYTRPDEKEVEAIRGYIASRPERKTEALQQVVWALLTSPEFRFNH